MCHLHFFTSAHIIISSSSHLTSAHRQIVFLSSANLHISTSSLSPSITLSFSYVSIDLISVTCSLFKKVIYTLVYAPVRSRAIRVWFHAASFQPMCVSRHRGLGSMLVVKKQPAKKNEELMLPYPVNPCLAATYRQCPFASSQVTKGFDCRWVLSLWKSSRHVTVWFSSPSVMIVSVPGILGRFVAGIPIFLRRRHCAGWRIRFAQGRIYFIVFSRWWKQAPPTAGAKPSCWSRSSRCHRTCQREGVSRRTVSASHFRKNMLVRGHILYQSQ